MKNSHETVIEMEGPYAFDQGFDTEELMSEGKQSMVGPTSSSQPILGVVIGSLKGFGKSGDPEIVISGNPAAQPVTAKTTAKLSPGMIGSDVILAFEGGNPQKPIILGVIHRPVPQSNVSGVEELKPIEARLDGKQVLLTAENEIVLRCGKASITLTRAGKILLSGEYLLSRSAGVNRVKGGSVQIN